MRRGRQGIPAAPRLRDSPPRQLPAGSRPPPLRSAGSSRSDPAGRAAPTRPFSTFLSTDVSSREYRAWYRYAAYWLTLQYHKSSRPDHLRYISSNFGNSGPPHSLTHACMVIRKQRSFFLPPRLRDDRVHISAAIGVSILGDKQAVLQAAVPLLVVVVLGQLVDARAAEHLLQVSTIVPIAKLGLKDHKKDKQRKDRGRQSGSRAPPDLP